MQEKRKKIAMETRIKNMQNVIKAKMYQLSVAQATNN